MKTWPKFLFLLVVLFAQTGCFPFWKNQENLDEFHFEIDPSVKKDKQENALIIEQLEDFLATKNASISENEYWDPKDLERYRFPFGSLFEIENGPLGKYQYSPKLKEIKPLGSKKMGYRLEIDFIGEWSFRTRFKNESEVLRFYYLYPIPESKPNASSVPLR